jgi:hypothetical protein
MSAYPVGPLFEDGRRKLFRSTDPETSKEAANRVTPVPKLPIISKRASFVAMIMRDQIRRTDEEIAIAARLFSDYRYTESSLRHGRRELADAGFILDTGVRRSTTNGRQAIVWQYCTTAATMRVWGDDQPPQRAARRPL